jgi:putative ABC transport system substrate-binding protein
MASRAGAQTAKLPRVALVFNTAPLAELAGPDPSNPYARRFVHGLRDLGLIEGRHVVIERRSAQGRPERLPVLMRELVAQRVDVIVASGPGVQQAHLATTTIPIVGLIDAPDSIGLTSSLSHPTSNVTGVATAANPAIHGKRLQLLKEIAPKATRVATIDYKYVDEKKTPGTHLRRRTLEAAARSLGVSLVTTGANRFQDLEPAFVAIARERADALFVIDNPLTFDHRRSLIAFAERQKLPAMYATREHAASGGLMAYGSGEDMWARMAVYVNKILKGARPDQLPFEQPTKYELVLNRRTAQALGLTIPQAMLLQADQIIE